jgi:hypothetical protein
MRRFARVVPTLVFLSFVSACGGLPESPEWDVVVAAPFTSDRLSVDDFLPAGIDTARVDGDKVFVLPGQREQSALQFASVCPTCPSGSTDIVPAFSYGDEIGVPLMTDVVQMELRDAEAVLSATNGLGFTLLGDTGDGTGSLEVVVLDRFTGTELGRERVAGPGTEWAAGEVLEVRVALGAVDVSGGIRVQFELVSPRIDLPAPVTLSGASSIDVDGGLQSLQVAAVTVRVDQVPVFRRSPIDINLDEGAEGVIDERLIGADVEFELRHDIAVEGPFVVTIADSRDALFSGDPAHEITLGQFTFAPFATQHSEIDAATVRRLVDFADPWIGYAAVGTGTLADPPGQGPLSRFTPESGFDTRVRVATTFRVGG